MEEELRQSLELARVDLKNATAELQAVGRRLDSHGLHLNAHQVDLDRQAKTLEKHAITNHESLHIAKQALDNSRRARDGMETVAAALDGHAKRLEELTAALAANNRLLKRLGRSQAAKRLRPRLKIVRGGRSSPPGPSPRRTR